MDDVFQEVETPMHTMSQSSLLIDTMSYKYKISEANNIVWHEHSNTTNNSDYNWHIVFTYLQKN